MYSGCSGTPDTNVFQGGHGRVFIIYTVPSFWTIGADDTGANFKISQSTSLGSNDRLTIDNIGVRVTSGSVGALDYAELFPSSEEVEKGELLEMDPSNEGT